MIPPAIRKRLSDDQDMKRCLICGVSPVEWHHTQSGMGRKQIQEWWAIAPLCLLHHRYKPTKKIMEIARRWCLNRATDEELLKYPKHNLIKERELLNRTKR